jgi:hypothetical protein
VTSIYHRACWDADPTRRPEFRAILALLKQWKGRETDFQATAAATAGRKGRVASITSSQQQQQQRGLSPAVDDGSKSATPPTGWDGHARSQYELTGLGGDETTSSGSSANEKEEPSPE